MKILRGKKAFLTGAASGIGKAIALELAESGCDLALVDIDSDGLSNLKEELAPTQVQILTIVCDISRKEEITKAAQIIRENWGELDLLVNNAGVAYYGPTHNMTEDQWDWLMDINLRAPIHIVREFLPLLMEKEEAHILNVCSIAGIVSGGRSTAYHVSKYGLVGFSESLRAEYGRRGLGVTALCPGPVKTNLYQSAANGRKNRAVPEPPTIICATEKRVAQRAIKGIRKNKRMVLVTPLAYFLYYMKRAFPGLIDGFQQFSRSKIKSRLKGNPAQKKKSLQTESEIKKAA